MDYSEFDDVHYIEKKKWLGQLWKICNMLFEIISSRDRNYFDLVLYWSNRSNLPLGSKNRNNQGLLYKVLGDLLKCYVSIILNEDEWKAPKGTSVS